MPYRSVLHALLAHLVLVGAASAAHAADEPSVPAVVVEAGETPADGASATPSAKPRADGKEEGEALEPQAADGAARTAEAGLVEVRDAKGRVTRYDDIQQLRPELFLVAKASGPNKAVRFGVIRARGEVVVPLTYAHIEHDADHHRFKVRTPGRRGGDGLLGYLDENGRVVVPAVYERLERVSNMGDEPTCVAGKDGKFGYLDFITGEILIEPLYDALVVDSLQVDAEGRGLVVARLGGKAIGKSQAKTDKTDKAGAGKWGVLWTDGRVLAPFEFDAIGDVSLSHEFVVAERRGQLVRLRFSQGVYLGASEVRAEYSSNFVPRLGLPLAPSPLDGLYAAVDYPTMKTAWDAWRQGVLRWAAIPSIGIRGTRAHVAFGQFANVRLPLLPNDLAIQTEAGSLTLMRDAAGDGPAEAAPFLTFTVKDGTLHCVGCEALGLPVRWHKVPVEAPAPFGGIGVVIQKAGPEAALQVTDVLADGPAQRAGLQAGDVVLKIDGDDAGALSSEQARDRLRGAEGSVVVLQLSRDGEPLPRPVSVVRAIITLRR